MTNDLINRSHFLIRLVDDEPDVLSALSLLLECAGWRTRAYLSAQDFLKDADANIPGCLILDILMPKMSGMSLQQEMIKRNIPLPIIFVTGHASVTTAVNAFRNGAIHYLEKPVEKEELFAAIEEVCLTQLKNETSDSLSKKEIIQKVQTLTERQKQVLLLATMGFNSREIGERLNISHRTVLGHRLSLNRIFGMHTADQFEQLSSILSGLQREEKI